MGTRQRQNMANSKQEAREKRPASELLRVCGAVLLAVAIIAGAAFYMYDFALGLPAAIGAAVLAVLFFVVAGWTGRREKSRERMASFLLSEFGSAWDASKDLRQAKKFVDGTPTDITFSYPKGLPDHSPEWRNGIEDLVRQRMGTETVKATWNQKRSQVRMRGLDVARSPLELAREQVLARTQLIFKPLFRGVDLRLGVSEWNQDDDLQPARIELSYGVTALDGSDLWQRKVEAMAGLKLGGRWRARFDPTNDRGYLEPRPELPKSVPHPGVSLYSNLTPEQKKSPILYYGVDEDGKDKGWKIGKTTTMPHMLCIGPTGGGKTTVLRSLAMACVAQGIPVFAADPKMIELTPFYGFPGMFIASTPEEIAKMIDDVEALMYSRYEAIKTNPNAAKTMTPVMLILDELLILRQVLTRMHKKEKKTGKPTQLESIAALLALARSAMINVVIGVQRPDATLFDDGARDNMRQRLSLMRLSSQGSQMLWGNGFVGVDLPMVQGRAMASPDGDNPIEMQTYWIADPVTAEGADKETLEAFRQLGEENFRDYEMPIDVSPYIGNMPVLDSETLPRTLEDIDLGAGDAVTEKNSNQVFFDSQDVRADNLTVGDKIVMESGEVAEILEVDDDPFDEDSVALTLSTANGDEGISFPRDEHVGRVLDIVDA